MQWNNKRPIELTRLYAGAGVIVAIWFIFGLYKSLSLQVQDSLDAPSRWILIGVGIINVIAIAVLFFMVVRIIAKVYFERRKGILGSRLRARLVTTLFAVSILPSVILFLVGRNFISKNVDRWFQPEVQQVLVNGKKLADDLEKTYQDRLSEAVNQIKNNKMKTPSSLEGSDLVGILDSSAKNLQMTQYVVNPKWTIPVGPKPNTSRSKIDNLQGQWNLQTVQQGGVRWIVGVVIPRATLERIVYLRQRYKESMDLSLNRDSIEILPQRTFLLLTVLTLFIAVWFGLTLAKSLSEPIRDLASAAQKVGAGDLETQINISGEDEIAYLGNRFNSMIQELKKSQTAIQDQSKNIELQRLYLDQLLSALPVGVLNWNSHGELLVINATTCHLFGIEFYRQQIPLWTELKHKQGFEQIDQLLKTIYLNKQRVQEEIRLGGESDNRLLRVIFDYQQGGSVLAVIEDLSMLAQAEKRAAWQEVARRMAHEIKNPLTPIQLTAQHMLRKSREGRLDNASVVEATETILAEVLGLSKLVDSFSKFAKLPSPVMLSCDPIELLQTVALLYETSHQDILWTIESDASCTYAKWDRDMIKRALINLIDNAVNILNESIPADQNKIIKIKLYRQKEVLCFSVEDNGPGVSPENRDHIFEPYFSMNQKGTGLGLAIVQKIAHDHGGVVRLEVLQQGSRFIIQLPV